MKTNRKNRLLDGIILGFALFSMYFGSGNVIFPPHLGLECGPEWLAGVSSYLISDIAVSMLIFVAVVRIDGDVNSITRRMGKRLGMLLISLAMICIGPLFCIPRAAATTLDMLVTPITGFGTGTLPAFLFIVGFFALTYVLSVNPGSVCDIIGKILTPILILFVALLVLKGIITPIGAYSDRPLTDNVVYNGVIAGYQSMECFGGLTTVAIIMMGMRAKGYVTQEEKTGMTNRIVVVCFLCLLGASVGLAYLGATTSRIYDVSISQGTLVVNIANHLFGNAGGLIIGILAGLACLTTSVGVTSGVSQYFAEKFPKLKYKTLVLGTCLLDVAIASIGLTNIVKVAIPVLSLLYPVVVLLVVMGPFYWKIRRDSVYKGAALATFIVSILSSLSSLGVEFGFTRMIPFFGIGLGWVIPAVIGGVIGWFFGKDNPEIVRHQEMSRDMERQAA